MWTDVDRIERLVRLEHSDMLSFKHSELSVELFLFAAFF